jgi:hypothetical protein
MRNACSKQPERMVRGNKGSKTYERETLQTAADQEDFIYAGITEQRLSLRTSSIPLSLRARCAPEPQPAQR